MPERSYQEWKDFLGLSGEGKLDDESLADELNYFREWEWGQGVDSRDASIGAAIVLREINQHLTAMVWITDNRPVLRVSLFKDYTCEGKDTDLEELLKEEVNGFDVEEDIDAFTAMLERLLVHVKALPK